MFLSPLVALAGLPITAAGIAGLAYRGKGVMAAVAGVIGVVLVAVVQPADVVFAVPALAAVLLAVVLLPAIDFQLVGLALVTVFGIAGYAHDSLILRAQGTSPAQLVSSTLDQALAQAEKSAGPSVTPDALQRMREVTHAMASALPTFYFISAFAAAIAVIVVITWAARRSGKTVNVPSLSRVDLSPYVLLPFVVGVLLVAASYSAIPNAAILGAAGLNLVLCVRALFLLQGLGVAAGALDRTGVGLAGRILTLAVLVALDAVTYMLSFAGLLDFWLNFRRLPRDGVTTPAPAPWVSDR